MKAQKTSRPKHSTSTPQSGHSPHQPHTSTATEAIPPLHHCAGHLHRRRTGKIARLPSETRDFLNNLLHDGAPYSLIAKKLAERGPKISADNLSRWRSGGYQEWLHDKAWIEEMRLRFDFATKIANHKKAEDLDAAGLRIAVTQMYSLLTTFDPALLNPKIANHPHYSTTPPLHHSIRSIAAGSFGATSTNSNPKLLQFRAVPSNSDQTTPQKSFSSRSACSGIKLRPMTSVRLGLIGLGNIGQHHAAYLMAGKVTNAELVAVSDAVPSKLEQYKPLKVFNAGEELISSGLIDAVIIATPHYQHTSLGIAALKQALHVMVEKPISAHKADAERLIAAHRARPDLVFAGMFQLRAEPRYLKIRNLLQTGELGQVVRMSWIMTDWFRTEAYYASGGWRATWKGEGGGVLLNQCLHNLDVLQWLLGMPSMVRGFCQLGRFHEIEVEDNVTAYLEFPNGASGTVRLLHGEAPGHQPLRNRRHTWQTGSRKITGCFSRATNPTPSNLAKLPKLGFAKPDVWNIEIPFENAANGHAILMQNFVNAILQAGTLSSRPARKASIPWNWPT
jgi:predicted dehydrogenase